jgi:hypothetical protein
VIEEAAEDAIQNGDEEVRFLRTDIKYAESNLVG